MSYPIGKYPSGYPIRPPYYLSDSSQLGLGMCKNCKFSAYDKDWKPDPNSKFATECVAGWYHVETRCMHHKVVMENLPRPPVGCVPGIPVMTIGWCDYYESDENGKVEELDYQKILNDWIENNKEEYKAFSYNFWKNYHI